MAASFAGTDKLRYDDVSGGPSLGALYFRLKTTQATANIGVISTWGGTSRSGFGFILNTPTTGKISVLGYSGSVQRVNLASTTNVNDGNWWHIAYNWNLASGGANELFANGISEASANASGAWTIAGAPSRFEMGRFTDAFWGGLIGEMAEIALWTNRNLIADEVTALSKGISPKLINRAGLVCYAPNVRDQHNRLSSTLTTAGAPGVTNHPRVMGGLT